MTRHPGKSRFPERRNDEYRAFIRAHECLLQGALTIGRMSYLDERTGSRGVFRHHCWGRIECAHVEATQGTGGYDVGETVPLCHAAHHALDQVLGPAEWAQATGLDLSDRAQGFAVEYVERGGKVLCPAK